MENRKPTICPRYISGDRCQFIQNLEEGIRRGCEGIREIRDEYHKKYCAYNSNRQCPHVNKE